MSQITQRIQGIINARAQHLPVIQARVDHLRIVQDRIDGLRKLVDEIEYQLQKKSGVYFNMIADDPKIEFAFNKVKNALLSEDGKPENAHICKLLNDQLKRLENLQKRFERQAIRVAFFGQERQGKSTFLKTITGLNDKVIPAYSGDSCTGAVSVIHNEGDSMRVDVQYYSLDEFLAIVQQKVNRFYNKPVKIKQLSDILHLPEELDNKQESDEFNKFRQAYVDNYKEYSDLVDRGLVSYYDEDVVAKHVAQYEQFDHQVPGSVEKELDNGKIVYRLYYYKYIAVKSVDIYTPFLVDDTALIELVDTIGIGGAADGDNVKKEMYRVLREDCDAGIDLYRPEKVENVPELQRNILNSLWSNLKDLDPAKWLVYVVNRIPAGEFKNVAAADTYLPKIQKSLETKGKECPVAWVRDVKGADLEDVTNLLINPLLDLITTNLPTLDSNLMSDARQKGEELYLEYASLVNDVENVLKSSMKHGGNTTRMFRTLYKKLRDEFATAMTSLRDQYQNKYLQPCPEVEQMLESVIVDLYDTVPDSDEINALLAKGKAMGEAYDIFCDQFCNKIYSAFETVSTEVIVPLREKVKMDVIKLLFAEAKMGKIRLVNYDVANGPSVEWLECLLKEKVSVETYPALHDALNFILIYHFNIEDAIEADVATSIGSIDKLNYRDFIQLPQFNPASGMTVGDFIFQEIVNRVPMMQSSLRMFKNRFALMPSHSFATRVSKFHVKVIRDEQTLDNMEEFFIDNQGAIWKSEFQSLANEEMAFGKWNEVCEGLTDLANKEKFLI